MITLREIKQSNPKWFTAENKEFFKDVDYWAMPGKSGLMFLVRSTYAWTDMFWEKATLHYRINSLGEGLIVGNLIDDVFADMDEVEEWLEAA